jgi:signal transduction histidine kinase
MVRLMARLLIVDDVPDNVALLAGWLAPKGHELVTATSGLEALRLADQQPPHLALLDLAMPGLDGVELARLLHRRPATKALPIILVTARGEATERLRALQSGIHEVLTKPVEPAELLARVASLLRLKALDDELARTREELVRKESLATIGLLVAGAAHEVNNPLSSAVSFVAMVRETLAGRPADDLGFALEQLERVKRLVAALLGLSRQSNSYEETLSLERVASDALRVARAQPEAERVRLELQATPAPELRGNFAQLAQVALNLISNALQASRPEGGRVRVTAGEERDAALGRCASLRVEDDGAGVPEPLREEIFKPFFTTKPVGAGLGLGLYTCRLIAERHRGAIRVASSPLGGAAFTLLVPLDP